LLCEDELELRKDGYIADSTYELWADGMRSQLEQPIFKNVWQHVQKEASQPSRPLQTIMNC
jgi:hypothetical protein